MANIKDFISDELKRELEARGFIVIADNKELLKKMYDLLDFVEMKTEPNKRKFLHKKMTVSILKAGIKQLEKLIIDSSQTVI